MTAVEDDSSSNDSRGGLTRPPVVGGPDQTSNIPRTRLKRPLTREDIPHVQSTVKLFKGLMNGTFTERQRKCIAKNVAVGPVYESVMVRKRGYTVYVGSMIVPCRSGRKDVSKYMV